MPENESPSTDKFDTPMGRELTYRELLKLAYASHFIPYLKILEEEIGREKVVDTLRRLAIVEAGEYARHVVAAKGKADLSVFRVWTSNSTGRSWKASPPAGCATS
ncbi:MAG: hypothetical protein A2135_00260 [Actinobacteria bacterium RBG_16_67_15]|nr:MAG: hypothetical protein A2135_00260 [Actinobacteria bacterium RBG_16_67_15]